MGGYLEYRGGVILSTVGDVQYRGGIMMHVGGYHEYRGGGGVDQECQMVYDILKP